MKYNFDEITKRKNTYSMKYDDNDFFLKMAPDLQLNDQTIRMMLADTDFRCAPMITKRLQEVAAFPTFGYTTVNSDPYYFEAIINWYQKRHDFAIKKEWIIPANPKYYDIVNAFNNTDTITRRKSHNFMINDIVYIYFHIFKLPTF